MTGTGGREPDRTDSVEEPRSAEPRSAERMKVFTDAVVAIAMTLLILPLLDSVPEAVAARTTTAGWLTGHTGQLLAFALSFVIIARFWMGHHELYLHVRGLAPGLMEVNTVWMLAIVWLPVATAMVGSMRTDRLQILCYVGAMLLASLASVVANLIVRRHPRTWEPDDPPTSRELAGAVATAVLFATALLLAVAIPGVGYYAMLLLLLTPAVERAAYRLLGSRAGR